MLIQQSSVVLDMDYKNILVRDFKENYSGVDSLTTAENVVKVMDDVFKLSDKAEEYVYLICLTSKLKPISFFEVSHGTGNASLIGIREIFIRALLCGAACIIIVHNHPSGDAEPSAQDIYVTKRIKEAAGLIGVTFCDHIIIGRENYFSFVENEKKYSASNMTE
ncbi:hypothetical protein C823_005672 [Eubacterium plexicaudatum ASF492]|uniref:MPN domain-containing protein n=1 Tax=Eubacterium plexicaudatum ASF492 TaxID=1235802 RepID=N2AUU3_9FIRM|nr:hypothetical protein C823_005672 [Eubacterium plexicaudatum ASF492]MDE6969004.1 JAB domain-containing protein [Eubacterium sp.]